jgi:2-polyprenyl-3-methyl-5-hydroxy-6-metoxy-1,4-benzoquinol methylase
MIYYIKNKARVFSHNSARSDKQASKVVLQYIDSLDQKEDLLDFGCGKLRYSLSLKAKCKNLTLVDSSEQLERVQVVHNINSTVVDYTKKNLKNTRVINVENLKSDLKQYDYVFCSNVLSAIPCEKEIQNVLSLILNRIKFDGEALFITQYTNSFYSNLSKCQYSKKHLYGWLTEKNGKATYYGLLDCKSLSSLLSRNGFEITKSWRVGQSAFVRCKRPL